MDAPLIAVLADLRANLTALDAVLADARAQGAQRFVVIGSLLSYGPDPVEVAQRVFALGDCATVLIGHPDPYCLDLTVVDGLNAHARIRAEAVRLLLHPRWWQRAQGRLWTWLRSRPVDVADATARYVSGVPQDPFTGLLSISGGPNDPDIRANGELITGLCFIGSIRRGGLALVPECRWWSIEDGAVSLREAQTRVLVCPGSVGLPGDGDPRAGYCLTDGRTVLWRRIAYDWEATARRLESGELDDFRTAERIRRGL